MALTSRMDRPEPAMREITALAGYLQGMDRQPARGAVYCFGFDTDRR